VRRPGCGLLHGFLLGSILVGLTTPSCSVERSAASLPAAPAGGSGPAADIALPIDELVRRHVEARGGKVAIEAIDSVEIDLRIVEPSFEVTGLYRADRKGRMRIDIFNEGKRVFSESFDGRNGWQLAENAAHPTPSEKGSAALRNSAQMPTKFLGLHEMTARGHRLDPAGREAVGGNLYHVIVLTLAGGQSERYYLDPETYLITRSRAYKPLHPDVDPTPTTIESVYSDFRTVAGVRFAFQAVDTDLTTGKVLQRSTILDLRPNRPAEDALLGLAP